MARLQYDPVAGPAIGNAAFAVNDAARNVSAGITALGTGLTELGSRREKRIEAENAKREAQAVNAIKMYAEMAPDEAALQALMQDVTTQITQPGSPIGGSPNLMDRLLGGASAVSPIGANTDVASIFGNRRTNLLADETTKAGIRSTDATTAGTEADTAGQLIKNSIDQLDLDAQTMQDNFNTKFATRLNEYARLSADGKIEEANTVRDGILAEAGDEYGARPDSFFERGYKLLSTGDDARSGVTKNALDIEGKEASIGLTRAQTAASIAAESDRNRLADYNYTRTVAKEDQAWAKLQSDKTAIEYFNGLLRDAGSFKSALETVDKDSSLSDEQKNLITTELNKEYSANPKLFDLYNPTTDKTRTELMGYTPEQAKEAPQASTRSLTAIQDRATRIQELDPSLGIFNRAEALTEEFGDLNGNVRDFPARVAELFPEKKVPDWLQNEIADIQLGTRNGHRRLSEPEMLAIIEESFGTKKTGFFGMGEEQRQLKKKVLRDTAKAYATQDRGTLAVRSRETSGVVRTAARIDSDITRMSAELSRAIDDGNEAKVADLRARISMAEVELMDLDLQLGGSVEAAQKEALERARNEGKTPEQIAKEEKRYQEYLAERAAEKAAFDKWFGPEAKANAQAAANERARRYDPVLTPPPNGIPYQPY